MCCRQGEIKNGCDGKVGGVDRYECTAEAPSGKMLSLSTRLPVMHTNYINGIFLKFFIKCTKDKKIMDKFLSFSDSGLSKRRRSL